MNTSDIDKQRLQCVLVCPVCMSGEGLAWTQHCDVCVSLPTIHFVTSHATPRHGTGLMSLMCLWYPRRCTVTAKRSRPESPILHHTTHHCIDIPAASRGPPDTVRRRFFPHPRRLHAAGVTTLSSAVKEEDPVSPANILFVHFNTRKKTLHIYHSCRN